MSARGHGGWFDQWYGPESVRPQAADVLRRSVTAMGGYTAAELREEICWDDRPVALPHDVVDAAVDALRVSLLAELRRGSLCSAAPQVVGALPHFLVDDAVERSARVIVEGSPGADYPVERAVRLDDLSSNWTATVGVRTLRGWAASEGLREWAGPGEEQWLQLRRQASDASPEEACARLVGRRVIGVHVEHGDHPRFEHGYEQAEIALDDGSLVVFDAKDSTWVGEDTDLTVCVNGETWDDLPGVLHALVGKWIDEAAPVAGAADAEFAVELVAGGAVITLSARGDGATIELHTSENRA